MLDLLDLLRLRFAREDCARLAKLASLARDMLDLLRLRFARENCARLAKLASLARNMLDLHRLREYVGNKRKKSKFEANNIFKKKPSQKEKNWEIKQKNYF